MSLAHETPPSAPAEVRRVHVGHLAEVLDEVADEVLAAAPGPFPDGTIPDRYARDAADRAAEAATIRHAIDRLTWRHQLDRDVLTAYADSDPAELRKHLVGLIATAVAWVCDLDGRTAAGQERG